MQFEQIGMSPSSCFTCRCQEHVLLGHAGDEHGQAHQDNGPDKAIDQISSEERFRIPENGHAEASDGKKDSDKDGFAPGAIPSRERDRENEEDGKKQNRAAEIIRDQDDCGEG